MVVIKMKKKIDSRKLVISSHEHEVLKVSY